MTNRLVVHHKRLLFFVFFFNMLLNADSECFLMILVSSTRTKWAEK